MAAMLVPLVRAATWSLQTKLYSFWGNTFPNHARMKNRTDLDIGNVVDTSIIYHIPDSCNLFNGKDF